MTDDDVTVWIAQLHGCDEVAAKKIWDAYFPQLARLARDRLGRLPTRAADEEDVALSAMNSFFRGFEAGRFKLDDRNDLWKLLATITIRKVTAQRRRALAAKRGGGQVRGESVFQQPGKEGERLAGLAEILMDENRMPELADDVAHMCRDLLDQLGDERLKRTAILKMEGYTNQEIADQLGCSVPRAKQLLARIRDKWRRELP